MVHDRPHLHGAVATAGHQGLVYGREGHLPHAALVAVEGGDGRQVRGAPQPHGLVLRGGGDDGVVGRHRHGVDILVVCPHTVRGHQLRQHALAACRRKAEGVQGQGPALEDPVRASRGSKGHPRGVRGLAARHAHRSHCVGVALADRHGREGGHVPQQHAMVLGRGRDVLTVRTDVHAQHDVLVALQQAAGEGLVDDAHLRGVGHQRQLEATATGVAAVGDEGHVQDLALGADQQPRRLDAALGGASTVHRQLLREGSDAVGAQVVVLGDRQHLPGQGQVVQGRHAAQALRLGGVAAGRAAGVAAHV
eukprot:Colp12_sorted_trinity150504_noHs@32111